MAILLKSNVQFEPTPVSTNPELSLSVVQGKNCPLFFPLLSWCLMADAGLWMKKSSPQNFAEIDKTMSKEVTVCKGLCAMPSLGKNMLPFGTLTEN